jgi:hypothetical protein
MHIVIDMEDPDDHRSLFRVLVGDKLVAERLTAAQSHLLVGDILERLVLGAPAEAALPPAVQTSAAEPLDASPEEAAASNGAVHPIWSTLSEAARSARSATRREAIAKTASRLSSGWGSILQMGRTAASAPARWPAEWAAAYSSRKALRTAFELWLERERAVSEVSLPSVD